MAELKIELIYDTSKFITRAVGINLEKLPINNKRAKADIEVNRIYFYTNHFVVNSGGATLTSRLIPPAGHRVRFPGYPKDEPPLVTWPAEKANLDYFFSRRFYLEAVPAGEEA
jgi:hypothetical protein